MSTQVIRDSRNPSTICGRIFLRHRFAKQADVSNVTHAYSMLAPGGRLVSIMASSFTFRTNVKSENFRALVSEFGSVKPNPEGSFKESGTNVNMIIVVLDKPR